MKIFINIAPTGRATMWEKMTWFTRRSRRDTADHSSSVQEDIGPFHHGDISSNRLSFDSTSSSDTESTQVASAKKELNKLYENIYFFMKCYFLVVY